MCRHDWAVWRRIPSNWGPPKIFLFLVLFVSLATLSGFKVDSYQILGGVGLTTFITLSVATLGWIVCEIDHRERFEKLNRHRKRYEKEYKFAGTYAIEDKTCLKCNKKSWKVTERDVRLDAQKKLQEIKDASTQKKAAARKIKELKAHDEYIDYGSLYK